MGALQCFRDISHHKSLETKLRMAEAISKDTADFFDNVVQGANVWISFSDSHGAVLLWNDFAERLSGFSAGEVIGQNSLKLIYPDEAYRKQVEENISRALEVEGMVRNFTTTVTPKNGKERILSWNITPLPDGTGENWGNWKWEWTLLSFMRPTRRLTRHWKQPGKMSSASGLF